MTKTYTSLTSFKPYADYDIPRFIDMAPLEAALRGLCVLFGLVMSQGAKPRRVDKISKQIYQAVKALTAAGYHNFARSGSSLCWRLRHGGSECCASLAEPSLWRGGNGL